MILTKMRTVYNWDEIPLIVDLSFASILLGVSIAYLKKLSEEGIFPAFKCGKGWKVEKNDLMSFIEERKSNK